jgi:hypothetical protein
MTAATVDRTTAVRAIADAIADRTAFVATVPPGMLATVGDALSPASPGGSPFDCGLDAVLRVDDAAPSAASPRCSPSPARPSSPWSPSRRPCPPSASLAPSPLFGGVLAGVAPAALDQAAALACLETTKVFPSDDQGRLGAHIDPEMVGRVTAARRQLPGWLSSAR